MHILINVYAFGSFGNGFGGEINIYTYICTYTCIHTYIHVLTYRLDLAASGGDLEGILIIRWAAGIFQEKLVWPRGVKRGRGWGQRERGKGGG